MKSFYRVLGLILFLLPLFENEEIAAQNLGLHTFTTGFAIAGGSPDGDMAEAVAIDEAGNRYITGYFEGSIDFEPGAGTTILTSAGGRDIFVAKYSAAGNLIWAKSIGGTSDDRGTGIAVDAGYVYVSGQFYQGGPITIGGTTLTSAGGWDMLVMKMDRSDGSISWAKSYGTAGTATNTQDIAYGIACDGSGNIYLTGIIGSTINGSNGTVISFDGIEITIAGQLDVFIAKLNSSGNAQWVKGIGGTSNAFSYAITVAGDYIYTGGNFAGSNVDFNRGSLPAFTLSASGLDGFITKHNLDGNLQWAAKVGGTTGTDCITSLAIDAEHNVFSTGYFNGTNVSFGNSVTLTSSGTDAFVWKMNASGITQWATKMSSSGSVMGYGIAVNERGDIYTSGTFEGTDASFGNDFILTSNGFSDVFLAKMNRVGETIWVEGFGGELSDYSRKLMLYNNEEVITVGGFMQTANLDPDKIAPNIISKGLTDIFLHSFTPTPTGSGTEADPYLISNIDELEWIGKSTDRWNKHYKQIKPINGSHTQYWNAGAGWIPIGNETVKFTGTYDGNNLIIADLFLDRTATPYNGLFGYAENASLTGIGLVNMNIRGGSDEHFTVATYDGGLVGYASATVITDCYTTGSIRGFNTVGGLAGGVASGSKVKRSYSSAVVGGTENLGGFIGSIADSEVAFCFSKGDVIGTGKLGGFVGHNAGTIADCYVLGSNVTGSAKAAGFVGNSDGVILRSYSNATLLGDSKNGFAADGVGNITNSFWDVENDGMDTSVENDVSFGAIGKTSEQLKKLQTFLSAEWDFKDGAGDDIWNIGNGRNSGYPYFNWQFAEDIGFQFITFKTPEQRTYGDASFSVNASVTSGLELSFTSSNTTVAAVSGQTILIKGAGSTTITASQAGNDNYLPAQAVEQILVVVAKPLIIAANDKEKVYGQTDPDFDVSYGEMAYDETPSVLTGTLALNRETGENAGLYKITPTGLSSSNYEIIFESGQLEITPAALTISAADETKVYGDSDPMFVVTYDGFQFTDDAASLSGELIIDRATGENVGSYNITPSGLTSSNYDISFEAGQLEITPKTLFIAGTFTAEDKIFDGTNNAVMATSGLFVETPAFGDAINLVNVILAFETTGPGADIPVSILSAEIEGDAATNYLLNLQDAPTAMASVFESQYKLTLNVLPATGGTVTGSGEYKEGESISITATANEGYLFVNWTLLDGTEISSDATVNYTMPAMAVTLIANFEFVENVVELLSSNMNIFPNPARSFVKIETGSVMLNISITDTSGRVVLSERVYSNELRINTSNFKPGIYIVRTELSEGIVIKKLQIVR
jgi:hypothetical protein